MWRLRRADDAPCYLPQVFFVGRHGVEHFQTSMRVQYELTQRFSAEWSIRAFLVRHPEATCARLLEREDDARRVWEAKAKRFER